MSNIRRAHIVLLNGAPRAGKDTVADLMVEIVRRADPRVEVFVDRFAKPLNDAVKAAHGLSDVAWATLERSKDHPSPLLYGRTLREAKIAMGENYFKPLYGNTYAGRALLDRVRDRDAGSRGPIVVIVPDLGFEAETIPLVNSPAELTVVRIERPGADFSKDSRSYVDTIGVHATIQNSSTLDALGLAAKNVLGKRILPWVHATPSSFIGA